MISLFELPKGPSKKMIFFIEEECYGRRKKTQKKYHLVKWEDVCRPKEMGGLGVIYLDVMNICLISRWIWKLVNEQQKGV